MSNILEFRASQSEDRARGSVEGAGRAAQIVIFPGIRYERAPDPTPPEPANASGAGKRSRRGAK